MFRGARPVAANAPLFGQDLFGEEVRPSKSVLGKKFAIPPFSVLDGRSGEWLGRKRAWLKLGLQSEVGRGNVIPGYESARQLQMAKKPGEAWATMTGEEQAEPTAAKSVFDPVLCELAYRWWCPEGGQVIDPFAGGSVRGLVAGMLGRRYWGCELRPEQVAANQVQADTIPTDPRPVWVCGDSRVELAKAPMADFMFGCPPYGDLEVYSDDPRDISNMAFADFAAAYQEIIAKAAARLADDRFACFVVGDFRDTKGAFRNFVGGTVSAFKKAGLHLYNEGILVSPVGTACLRAARQFVPARKLVKLHQNVLTFVKGDWRKAVANLQEGF